MNLDFDPKNPQSSQILKEVHYYIYNNKMHNNLFVQHVLILHWDYLRAWDVIQDYMWFGRMDVQHNSSVHVLGILSLDIHGLIFARKG
jgi:hypothetical protein